MPPSALSLNKNTYDKVLPCSIFSLDLQPNEKRPSTFLFPYDRNNRMVFLNIEEYMEMAVWVSLTELVFYARQLKIQGEWCERHFQEFDTLCMYITEGWEIDGETLIYDGQTNGYIPLIKFMWLHSKKYRNNGDGYFVVEREGSNVDWGCAVMAANGRVQIADMFADGTAFFPPQDDFSSSIETITEDGLEPFEDIFGDDYTITTLSSTDVEEALEDLEITILV